MTTWYRITYWSTDIELVEVVRVSDAYVWYTETSYGETRRYCARRKSQTHAYFETYKEAWQALVDYNQEQIDRLEVEIEKYRSRIEDLKQ